MQPGDREHRQSSLPRSLQRHLRSGPQSLRTTEPPASTVASSTGTSAPRDETDTGDKDDDPFYDDDADGRRHATRMRAHAREREHGPGTGYLASSPVERALAPTPVFPLHPVGPPPALVLSAAFAHTPGPLPPLHPLRREDERPPAYPQPERHPPQGPFTYSHPLSFPNPMHAYDGSERARQFMHTHPYHVFAAGPPPAAASFTFPPLQAPASAPSHVPQRTFTNGEAGPSTRARRAPSPTARVLPPPAAPPPPPLDPFLTGPAGGWHDRDAAWAEYERRRGPQGYGLEEPHAPTHAPFRYPPAPGQGYCTEGEARWAWERERDRGRWRDEQRRAAADLDRQAAGYNREGASIIFFSAVIPDADSWLDVCRVPAAAFGRRARTLSAQLFFGGATTLSRPAV